LEHHNALASNAKDILNLRIYACRSCRIATIDTKYIWQSNN
jgi:hypothetical protein